METLIGTWLACTVTFWSHNPALKRDVQIKAEGIQCQVKDDRYERVGSPGHWQYPIFVDCSKAIMWLKPLRGHGEFFLTRKDCGL
jgi:hypothetical protein